MHVSFFAKSEVKMLMVTLLLTDDSKVFLVT